MSGFDIDGILERLPERYPLLLLDRVLSLTPGVEGEGLKNVTINEEFFVGHFPGHPVMPGVLILEAMAQVGQIVLGAGTGGGNGWRICGIDSARFRRPVLPGDALRLRVRVEPAEGDGGVRLRGEAFVGETLAAEASFRAWPAKEGGQ